MKREKLEFILGIETSCDETAASVVDSSFRILSNIVLSQDEIHAPYGGVVPELASRQHIRFIDAVVSESLRLANLSLSAIDAYAVTQGPGLIGSLLVGLSFAKGLAYYFKKPLIGVDHLDAHIEAAFLENRDIAFPVLALLVSGGHTSIFYLKREFSYELLGRTRDDAAGEALDKIAKFLALGYPGGPIIERWAEEGDPQTFPFAMPRMSDRSLDFSFSGLKTAALRFIREKNLSKENPRINDFLASFEQAVCNSLLENLSRALTMRKAQSLIFCGGVARNKRLRRLGAEFAAEKNLKFYVPSPKMCTDNAAMVASLGLKKLQKKKMKASFLDLNAYPRYAPRNFS